MIRLVSWRFVALLVLLAMALLVPVCLNAENTVPDTISVVWEIKPSYDGSRFFSIDGCKIFVPGNTTNWLIQIVAIDSSWEGKVLEQVITIRLEKEKLIKQDQRYLLNLGKKKGLYQKTEGYDIFRQKYYNKAMLLPEDARKIFTDLYNANTDSLINKK